MRKGIIILLLFCSFLTYGQSVPIFTQNVLNRFAINPATAGIESCPDFKFGHRRQWMGITGAPVNSFFTFNTSLGKSDFDNRSFHGVGARYLSDEAGPFKTQSFHLAYAYHLKLRSEASLAFGTYVGLRNIVYNGGSVTTPVFDPVVNQTTSLFIYPEVDPGLYYYSKDAFAGLSVINLIPFNLSFGGNQIGSPSPNAKHLAFHYGRIINARGYYYTYVPSIMVRYAANGIPEIDLNFMWYIDNDFALGATFRNPTGFSVMAEARFLQRFRFGYAFDYGVLGPVGQIPFSHEVILGFMACKDKEDLDKKHLCPAY
jgi:type IX secretion system PorP/SprF family membrane protein